jgi:hypothetical protein
MTAWEVLLSKSSLLIGTAWEHLNSVVAGGGGLVINDGVYLDYEDMTIQAELQDDAISLELSESEIMIEVSDNEITVEVCE